MAAEDDAERVTDRVGEDPEARLAFPWDAGGAQEEQFLLGLVGITHANVEVQLLGMGGVGPARRNPFGGSLKGQLPMAGLQADDHPVTDVFVDPHPQNLAIELRESARVGAVDHCLFEASDHTESMPATFTTGLKAGALAANWQRAPLCAGAAPFPAVDPA